MSNLVHENQGILQSNPEYAESARRYIDASRSAATRRAHEGDWRLWEQWCARKGQQTMPGSPDAACAFLIDMVEGDPPHAFASILRYSATLGKAHRIAGHPSPFSDAKVRALLVGMGRALRAGTHQQQKEAMTGSVLAKCLPAGVDIVSLRDRALLLVGMSSACRRSELCALTMDDIEFFANRVVIHIRRSKTDQTGKGRTAEIPRVGGEYCPVEALEAWLSVLNEASGPVFRAFTKGRVPKKGSLCTKSVNDIVKAAAARGGFDPAKFGGHSLRAGFVTDGISAGVSDGDLMAQTGHTNPKTLHRYNRGATDPNRARKMRDMLRAAFAKEKSERSS